MRRGGRRQASKQDGVSDRPGCLTYGAARNGTLPPRTGLVFMSLTQDLLTQKLRAGGAGGVQRGQAGVPAGRR